jgi:glycosyltransferase involved in cell wall biosynthesis
LLENEKIRSKLGKAGRELVIQAYSLEAMCARYAELLEKNQSHLRS